MFNKPKTNKRVEQLKQTSEPSYANSRVLRPMFPALFTYRVWTEYIRRYDDVNGLSCYAYGKYLTSLTMPFNASEKLPWSVSNMYSF